MKRMVLLAVLILVVLVSLSQADDPGLPLGTMPQAQAASIPTGTLLSVKVDQFAVFGWEERCWAGYLGPLRVSEQDFFWLAGDLGKAEEARAHAYDRMVIGRSAWVATVIGASLWILGENGPWVAGRRSRNKDEILTGQITLGCGWVIASLWVEMGKNAATLSIAQQAALKYNMGR